MVGVVARRVHPRSDRHTSRRRAASPSPRLIAVACETGAQPRSAFAETMIGRLASGIASLRPRARTGRTILPQSVCCLFIHFLSRISSRARAEGRRLGRSSAAEAATSSGQRIHSGESSPRFSRSGLRPFERVLRLGVSPLGGADQGEHRQVRPADLVERRLSLLDPLGQLVEPAEGLRRRDQLQRRGLDLAAGEPWRRAARGRSGSARHGAGTGCGRGCGRRRRARGLIPLDRRELAGLGQDRAGGELLEPLLDHRAPGPAIGLGSGWGRDGPGGSVGSDVGPGASKDDVADLRGRLRLVVEEAEDPLIGRLERILDRCERR